MLDIKIFKKYAQKYKHKTLFELITETDENKIFKVDQNTDQKMKKTISFEIELDENHLAEKLKYHQLIVIRTLIRLI